MSVARREKVSIKQIAEWSGCSPTAVSLIMNERPHRYSANTVRRVRETVAKHGYQPSTFARGVRMGSFSVVSILAGTRRRGSCLTSYLQYALYDALEARGLHMNIITLDDDRVEDDAYLAAVLQRSNADGVLIAFNEPPPPSVTRSLAEHGIPYLEVNTLAESDCVRPDDGSGVEQAIDYLRAHGHRRIAYMALPFEQEHLHYSRKLRPETYLQKMQRCELEPALCQMKGYPDPSWFGHVEQWLEKHDCTACVTEKGVHVIVGLLRAGFRVPEDRSVVAIGNIEMDHIGMRVTRINIPWREMAEESVACLVRKIDKPGAPLPPVVVPMVLVEGDTVKTV